MEPLATALHSAAKSFTLEEEGDFLRIAPTQPERGRALLFHGYGQTRLELLPLAYHLASAGYSAWLRDLPGHGNHPASLSLSELGSFAEESLTKVQPDLLVGYSLGARLALSLPMSRVIAISPPAHSRFDAEGRAELLRVLRPRWVRESGPMRGLSEAIDGLQEVRAKSALLLHGRRDLPSVLEGLDRYPASVEKICIPDSDHLSVLFSPSMFRQVLRWTQ